MEDEEKKDNYQELPWDDEEEEPEGDPNLPWFLR